MSRTDLLSPRYTLTKIPSTLFSNYCCHGHPLSPKMEDRPCDHVGRQLAGHKQALRDQMGCSQEDSDPRNKARRTSLLQEREAPRCSRVFLSYQASPTATTYEGRLGPSALVEKKNEQKQQIIPVEMELVNGGAASRTSGLANRAAQCLLHRMRLQAALEVYWCGP